jgi:methionine-rich copper-binding protein CopC
MLTALAMAAVPIAASAHSELDTSVPADGANLQTALTEVVLTFSAELNPDGSSFTVTDPTGAQAGTGNVDLNVAARNILRGDVSITKPGNYRIAWTSLSLDGDQLKGTVTFGYRSSSPPNTAMAPATGPLPLSAAGILLVAAGVLLVVRREPLR